jgi:hypothetical protein
MSFSSPTSPVSSDEVRFQQSAKFNSSAIAIPAAADVQNTLIDFINHYIPHLNNLRLSNHSITSITQLSDAYLLSFLLNYFMNESNENNSAKPVLGSELYIEPEEKQEQTQKNIKSYISTAYKYLINTLEFTPSLSFIERQLNSPSKTQENNNLTVDLCKLLLFVAVNSADKESVVEFIMTMSDLQQSTLMFAINEISNIINPAAGQHHSESPLLVAEKYLGKSNSTNTSPLITAQSLANRNAFNSDPNYTNPSNNHRNTTKEVQEINSLQSQLHALTLELRISKETQANLTKQFQLQHQKDTQSHEKALENLKTQLNHEWGERLKAVISEKSAEISAFDRTNKRISYELSEKSVLLATAEHNYSSLTEKNSKLSAELAELRDELHIATHKIAEKVSLEQKLSRMQSRLDSADDVKQQYDSLEALNQSYLERITSLQLNLAQFSHCKEENNTLSAELHRLQLLNTQISSQLQQNRAEKTELQQELAENTAELKKIGAEYKEIQRELAKMKESQLEERQNNFSLSNLASTPRLAQLEAENLQLKAQLQPLQPNSTQLELAKWKKIAKLWARKAELLEKSMKEKEKELLSIQKELKQRELLRVDAEIMDKREKLLVSSALHSLAYEFHENLVRGKASLVRESAVLTSPTERMKEISPTKKEGSPKIVPNQGISELNAQFYNQFPPVALP